MQEKVALENLAMPAVSFSIRHSYCFHQSIVFIPSLCKKEIKSLIVVFIQDLTSSIMPCRTYFLYNSSKDKSLSNCSKKSFLRIGIEGDCIKLGFKRITSLIDSSFITYSFFGIASNVRIPLSECTNIRDTPNQLFIFGLNLLAPQKSASVMSATRSIPFAVQ